MILFKKLQIEPDGNTFSVSAEIENYRYFENMYIAAVSIDTELTFTDAYASSSKAYTAFTNEDPAVRECNLNITATQMGLESLSGHIFYVYVQVAGTPSADTPCDMDKETTLGIAINWFPIYHTGLDFMKSTVSECCHISKSFIDYILNLKALELALKTAQYPMANRIFNERFKKSEYMTVARCGCSSV